MPDGAGIRRVVVDRAKITRYLLDPMHPIGAAKCALLERFGFSRLDPEALADALIAHFETHPRTAVIDDAWGRRLYAEGPLRTPSGGLLNLRTVWEIGRDGDEARFITIRLLKRTRPP